MQFDLDTPIFETTGENASWTIRNAVEGVQIFGGIGSGKSSSSGRFLALKYLSHGFGGLVLSAKPELDSWIEYCKETGRLHDLIVVEPKGKHAFNFLQYESAQGSDKSFTDNIVHLLKTVIRASDENHRGSSDDKFWDVAMDMVLAHIVDLCLIAYGKITVQMLYDIMQSLMDNSEDSAFVKAMNTATAIIAEKMRQWMIGKGEAALNSFDKAQRDVILLREIPALATNYLWQCRDEGIASDAATAAAHAKAVVLERIGQEQLSQLDNESYNKALFSEVPEARTLDLLRLFFLKNYRRLAQKTRSIIEFTVSGFLFGLLREPVFSLFCDRPSTFTPEDCLSGKIILIHLPVKTYHKVGNNIQIMFKYIWQRAMEKRKIDAGSRALFLWADEAQNFLHEYDAVYQATARSSRIATVYISQNLPNYYASMGGDQSKHRVNSLLGTFGTKIFHANADIETNKYASELIGEAWQKEETETVTTSNGTVSNASGITVKLQRMVRPEDFSSLATGGPLNAHRTSAYVHVQGKTFANGFSHRLIHFNQHFHLKP